VIPNGVFEGMAYDRYVRWGGKKPTRQEAQLVLEDFFAETATEIRWVKDRFFVTLVGKHSNPLQRVAVSPLVKLEPEPGWEGRHLEVWLGDDSLDVMTRQQDEFTNRVADGLAALFARYWEGKLG